MRLNLLNQALIFILYFTFIQCQNQEQSNKIEKNEFIKIGHNVLQNGRIISKPVNHPLPIDQIQTSKLQQDDTNGNKPKYIVNGDILTPIEEIELHDSKRPKRKVIAEMNYYGGSNRWPRGVVPYDFVSGIDYRVQQNVLNAIQHWHQRTCIRFEPYNPQRHWDISAKITIDDAGSGCATFVGYRPSDNGLPMSYSVYLPSVCPLGSAIHELGHVIGFYHEMARTDRDQEIIIYFNAMTRAEAIQYDIMPNPMPGYYGQPYDLGSIMHYRPTDVMVARDSQRSSLMGQRYALSFLDSKLANLAYHCSDNCNPKPVCENEGYVSQYCQCICPDGFYGDQCNLLQGYLSTTRVFTPDHGQSPVLVEVEKSSSTTASITTTENSDKSQGGVYWLEWSNWSNCSESCGSGIRVRTRLCSNTTIDGSSDPCSSVGGDSFEIESCQNIECNQADIIMSCTFDLPNEKCPLKIQNDWRIENGIPLGQTRPISDHTRGDGKYLIITKNTTQTTDSQKFQLDPLTHLKTSKETNHCLQFWYSVHGQVTGKITIVYNQIIDNTIVFHDKGQDTNWKQFQQTISNDNNNYELMFTYQSNTSDYNYIAIDDISIINGACLSKKINNQNRRKRRQASIGCSEIIDLTTTNTVASITSPNYPNLYPQNVQCYYYIRAPESYRIILQFTDFNIPTSTTNDCDDTIEIRYYNLAQPGPQYCGSGANSNNLQFTSTKDYILIVFKSDQSYSGRGFNAQAYLAQ